MTAQELHKLVDQHTLPRKIRYALVVSLQDPSLADYSDYTVPYWINNEAQHKLKADERFAHQFDPAPRNKTIAQLMEEYATRGMKVPARVELKKRVQFVAFEEQRQVLLAFLNNVAVDRKFALKFLDGHWDEFYAQEVERIWLQHRDTEAAKLIVHHFPDAFISAHWEALAIDFNYLQVRLRLPADSPIDRERLSYSAYLYLCARQTLQVDDKEAERMFFQNALNAIGLYYIRSPWRIRPHWNEGDSLLEDHSLCDVPVISSMVWSLGMLGKTEILLRFNAFHEKVYPLVMQSQWEEIRAEFASLNLDLDYHVYDESIQEHEQTLLDQARLSETPQISLSDLPPSSMSDFLFPDDTSNPDIPF